MLKSSSHSNPKGVKLAANAAAVSESQRNDADEIPSEFLCPITLDLMNDPVLLPCGGSAERSAVEAWLKKKRTNPTTNLQWPPEFALITNRALKSAIERFEAERKVAAAAERSVPETSEPAAQHPAPVSVVPAQVPAVASAIAQRAPAAAPAIAQRVVAASAAPEPPRASQAGPVFASSVSAPVASLNPAPVSAFPAQAPAVAPAITQRVVAASAAPVATLLPDVLLLDANIEYSLSVWYEKLIELIGPERINHNYYPLHISERLIFFLCPQGALGFNSLRWSAALKYLGNITVMVRNAPVRLADYDPGKFTTSLISHEHSHMVVRTPLLEICLGMAEQINLALRNPKGLKVELRTLHDGLVSRINGNDVRRDISNVIQRHLNALSSLRSVSDTITCLEAVQECIESVKFKGTFREYRLGVDGRIVYGANDEQAQYTVKGSAAAGTFFEDPDSFEVYLRKILILVQQCREQLRSHTSARPGNH